MSAVIEISVIIPTYNRLGLAERAVRSVLEQKTDAPFEIIVVDDGSTDGTAEHLRASFPDALAAGTLRPLELPHQGDPGAARNAGVFRARGKWVAFLDSDDQWKPGYLQALMPLLEKSAFIAMACDSCRELAGGAEGGAGVDWLDVFIRRNPILTSSVAMRQELFAQAGGFAEGYFQGGKKRPLQGFEDYELWLRAILLLCRRGELHLFRLLPPDWIVQEHQAGGAGRMRVRRQMMREIFTLARIAPEIPPRYWSALARRLGGALKGATLGGKPRS